MSKKATEFKKRLLERLQALYKFITGQIAMTSEQFVTRVLVSIYFIISAYI